MVDKEVYGILTIHEETSGSKRPQRGTPTASITIFASARRNSSSDPSYARMKDEVGDIIIPEGRAVGL